MALNHLGLSSALRPGYGLLQPRRQKDDAIPLESLEKPSSNEQGLSDWEEVSHDDLPERKPPRSFIGMWGWRIATTVSAFTQGLVRQGHHYVLVPILQEFREIAQQKSSSKPAQSIRLQKTPSLESVD